MQKNWLIFFGFASLDTFVIWCHQTTHFNQNGQLSIQNLHIPHFGSQELAKSAIFAKIMADFLGFASPDRFIVWSRETTLSNQNGQLSIQNLHILHFESQELATVAIFPKIMADFFGFASLDRFIVCSLYTTHSNQNGQLSIQTSHILHFGSQELANSATFFAKEMAIFWVLQVQTDLSYEVVRPLILIRKKARKADLANSRDRKCRICKSWWENRPFWLELVVWRPHTVNLSGLAKPKKSAFSAKNGWFS